ncbi:3-dehydroquinate synthase [Candidatus Avelusimicrobium luingense]|uniref:3-dehydroquinate synthase n=1 Tax=Candidatus Avelusimicrobium luingense TaxID=3416211 RepID=UPI003D0D54C9
MSTYQFTVENEAFSFDSAFLESDSFVVRSVPRDYRVLLPQTDHPAELIQRMMDENPKNLLLIDQNVWNLYLADSHIDEKRVMFVQANEEFKTLHNGVEQALGFLEKNGFGKGETLVVVGGGVTEDIGAFVGAVYKRGIAWRFFPTTLLSMCDSCIGGKTGINYHKAKNQLALFSAPREVIICPAFLRTLHAREIKSGLGEILKLFITGGPELLARFSKYVSADGEVNNFESFRYLILGALGVKKQIVEKDEFELNLRKSLNYGHTLGHAIEVLSDYAIPHGQAVTMGVLVVNEMSRRRGLLSQQDCDAIRRLARNLFQTARLSKNIVNELPSLLLKDKKSIGNAVNFVFIKKPGETVFVKLDVNETLIQELLTCMHGEFDVI